MAAIYRGTDEYALLHTKMPVLMSPFSHLSYASLYYLKFPFTLIWTFIFFAVSYFTLKKINSNKNILKILAWSYFLLVILAGLSMAAGYLINGNLQNDEYTFSRWLLGAAQSPIICFMLLASQKLYSKSLNL